MRDLRIMSPKTQSNLKLSFTIEVTTLPKSLRLSSAFLKDLQSLEMQIFSDSWLKKGGQGLTRKMCC